MRLIDADKIDFSKVFGGYSAFAKDLISAAQKLIDMQPTAYDRKRVIEELDKMTWNVCPQHECPGGLCRICTAKKAIEIAEKGGIE